MLSTITPYLNDATLMFKSMSEEEARKFISESASTLETCADAFERAEHYSQLGVAHRKIKQHQLGLNAFTAAIQSLLTENEPQKLANAYANRASAYLVDDNKLFGFSKGIADLETALSIHPLSIERMQSLVKLFLIRTFHPMCQYILTDRCPALRPFAQAALIKLSAKYVAKGNPTLVELCNFYLALTVKCPDLNLPEPYLFEILRKEAETKKLSAPAWEEIKISMTRGNFLIRVILDATEKLTDAQGYTAARLLTTRGLNYMRFVLYTDAIEDFNAAIDLIDDSNNYAKCIAFFNRGLAYFYNKLTAEALDDFNRAIRLSQYFTHQAYYAEFLSRVYSARAHLHIEKLNFDSACADIVSASEAHSNSIYLNNVINDLYHNFPLEYVAYCSTPDCNVVLRDQLLLLLNKAAAAINSSSKSARLHQELLNFYFRLLVNESIDNKNDFNIILSYANDHKLSAKARFTVKESVAQAHKRQQKLNPNQIPAESISDRKDKVLIMDSHMTNENAEKIIADSSELIARVATPFDKARALSMRTYAYKKMEHYSFALNDCHTIISLLTANEMNRAHAHAYISELYFHMDNYAKMIENLIISCDLESRFEPHRSILVEYIMERYFFKLAELILQPECPISLRSQVQSLLKREIEGNSLFSLDESDPIHVELCAFYRELSKNKLREFTDKSQTKSKILEWAVKKDLSTEAIQRIKDADEYDLAAKKERRLDYYQSKKPRYFDFFKELPPRALPERPANPIPELRI